MHDTDKAPGILAKVWHMSNRVNLRLLDALSDEQLAAVILPRGKSVTSYFVHIHMARFYWLERRDRALAKGVKKLPGGNASRSDLRQALVDSAKAMEEFLNEAERTGKVKSSKLGTLSPTKPTTAGRFCCNSSLRRSRLTAPRVTRSGCGIKRDGRVSARLGGSRSTKSVFIP